MFYVSIFLIRVRFVVIGLVMNIELKAMAQRIKK